MSAQLPYLPLPQDSLLSRCCTLYQIHWMLADEILHAHRKQSFALAEKSVRIGWTYADAFKNVRKRLRFKNRDYLFATKDYPSALEYIRLCHKVAELFNLTRSVLSHGEEYHKVPRLDPGGRPTGFTDELKMGVIKFDNGSRIMAFSSHPQAMAVYAGDVGLDEFAKHPNAKLLWETAQGRVTWGYDMAVWSSHDGEDTLFNEFAQEAKAHANQNLANILNPSAGKDDVLIVPKISPVPNPPLGNSTLGIPSSLHISDSTLTSPQRLPTPSPSALRGPHSAVGSPWNLYYRVTLTDAIELGLLDVINRVQRTTFTGPQFVADCRARARHEEIFQQAYLCNPLGASTNHIVDWSVIERCRCDYDIIRLHLEHEQILKQFGQVNPDRFADRQAEIHDFIVSTFRPLFQTPPETGEGSYPPRRGKRRSFRLGFDVAASGQGDLAAIYVDEKEGDDLWLRALFTCRTEDWQFLQAVLFTFLRDLRSVQAAGDSSGLGRQICWEASSRFGGRFTSVNFGSRKHDLGFTLMNQLATAQKRIPRSEQDIASDIFALRKSFAGSRWVFSEGRNPLNPVSHCDIAWAAALSTHAHLNCFVQAGGCVV